MKKINVIGQTKKRVLLAGIIGILGVAPATVALAAYLPGGIVASASTIDIDILSNMSNSNSSGTTPSNPWAADGQIRSVDFTITGSKLAEVNAVRTGPKQVYLGVPDELTGDVATNGSIDVDSNVTLNLDHISFLKNTEAASVLLVKQITKVLNGSVGSLVGVTINVDDFNQKLDAFNNIDQIGNINFDVDSELAGSGKFISADMDDSLGITLAANVRQTLLNLKAATIALEATGSGFASDYIAGLINGTLIPAKEVLVQTINSALPLLEPTGQAVGDLASAAVLGDTTVVIPAKITSPTSGLTNTFANATTDLKFPGVVVQTNTPLDTLVTFEDDFYSHIYYK